MQDGICLVVFVIQHFSFYLPSLGVFQQQLNCIKVVVFYSNMKRSFSSGGFALNSEWSSREQRRHNMDPSFDRGTVERKGSLPPLNVTQLMVNIQKLKHNLNMAIGRGQVHGSKPILVEFIQKLLLQFQHFLYERNVTTH
ncbi:hypothetical protein V8G54_029776 [Vigna mungo]|uniref:Uncharacterized protein n=1 Tax=Vigna mungo TaxID=3915 RepID=A0AAQ3MUY1_VIGMU